MEKQKTETKKEKNPMTEVKIEKVVLNIGAQGEDIEKAVRLLKLISGKKPMKTVAKKRIPSLNVRPGLEIGAVVTLRRDFRELLQRLLNAEDNEFRVKQVADNHFSFGIPEYIEIPGMEYQREIGIMGLDVTLVFKKSGRRVRLKKVKRGKFSKRQYVSKEEIIKFMEDNFETEFD